MDMDMESNAERVAGIGTILSLIAFVVSSVADSTPNMVFFGVTSVILAVAGVGLRLYKEIQEAEHRIRLEIRQQAARREDLIP